MDIPAAARRIWRDYFRLPKYFRYRFGAIGPHSRIGEECALVPENMFLEDYVVIQNRVNFISSRGKLVVKKFSTISSQTIIVTGTHTPVPGIPFYWQVKEHIGDDDGTITVHEDCWIGAGCVLLMKAADIGRGAVVGAGSVVTRPVPPYAVVVGNPAKVIAVKFSKEDIIKHEAALYPEAERMKPEEIDELFAKHYEGLNPMKCKSAESLGVSYDRATGQIIANSK